ncbi:hypothetical protein [Hyphobacterium sp.]|uniref:hypothetical protein n=1 Tax=Hyphobacterium sp. TaxID=2004662 RepID=UPI003BAC29DD
MANLTLAFGSAVFLLTSGSALADQHGDHAANDNPDRSACMEMHEAMMARHEAGEDHDTIMASLTDEERARAEACHEMMQAMHEEHHGDGGEGHSGTHQGHD